MRNRTEMENYWQISYSALSAVLMVWIHLSVSVLEVTILVWSWAYLTHPGSSGIYFLRNINIHRRHNHNFNLELFGVFWSPDANECRVETHIIWGRTSACNGKLLWYYI